MGLKRIVIAGAILSLTNISFAMADIRVVTSIKPVHSLVSGIMSGFGVPSLIIDGAGSPHTYSLKPSQAKQLQDANLVFWMGDGLETFLEGPLENIAQKATVVKLIDAHGLKKIKFREGGMFDEHDHGHEDHGQGEFDPHVWLDPVNAKAIVHEIEEALVKADPENASIYETNAYNMKDKLDSLAAELREELEPVHDKGFIVFHDAYQYFEQRFDMAAIGSITVSPEVIPGAERIRELRKKISELNATCVFSEPQFEPKLVGTLIDGTDTSTAVLDPLGASLTKGPDLYFQLLRNMALSFKKCLSGSS
jgi:zinc transport system substrate-binding protein